MTVEKETIDPRHVWPKRAEVVPFERINVPPHQRALAMRPWMYGGSPLFDPDAVGILSLSEDAHGDLWIEDGQHRMAACRNNGITSWFCAIWDAHTPERAMAIWAKINGGRKATGSLHGHMVWAGAGRGGDKALPAIRAHEIDQVLALYGMVVPLQSTDSPNAINAVKALNTIWNIGHNLDHLGGKLLLTDTVRVVRRAYFDNAKSTRDTARSRFHDAKGGYFLQAVARFLAYHMEHAAYNEDRLVAMLHDTSPTWLEGEADAIQRQDRKVKRPQALYEAMVPVYNAGQRGRAKALVIQRRALKTSPSPNQKLTGDVRDQIAEEVLHNTPLDEIQQRFNVGRSTINDIQSGRTWTRRMDLVKYGPK